MNYRLAASAALATALLAISAEAQPAAELMQRAIYAQETKGDLDTAIQLYRQVVAAAPKGPMAAQAQYRLTESLLRKGDLPAVGREFGILARDFSDSERLVQAMNEHIRAVAQYGPDDLLGSVQNGIYHHNATGVEVAIPTGWSVKGQSPQPDGGDRIDLVDSASQTPRGFLWVIKDPTPSERTAERLQQRLQQKLRQRGEANGYHDYKLRPESTQPAVVGGQQALTAVGDYLSPTGDKMIEWLVFVNTPKTRFFFSVHGRESEFAAVQQQASQAISTARIP